jgi:hypothetical protein
MSNHSQTAMEKLTTCEFCDDGTGQSVYPYAGVAPHTCGLHQGMPLPGSSVTLPRDQWPANFKEDASEPSTPGQYPGQRIYTHCLQCGAGADDHA